MYEGFLEVNGVEVTSAPRTRAYVQSFMPSLSFKCDEKALDAIRTVLHPALVSPQVDKAPWFNVGIPESADFYGFYSPRVDGGSDSSFTTPTTELIGDGAVFGTSRTGSLETRWTLVGFAKDEAAMEAGLTWLKEVLTARMDGHECDPITFRTLKAPPRTSAGMADLLRTYYNVGVTVPPVVTDKQRSQSGVAWTVTFTLRAGIPWGFAPWDVIGTLDMNLGWSAFSDPAGQNCSVQNLGYKDFINDPFYTAISLPPQPPVVKPPVILPVAAWRRKILPITSNLPARMASQRIEVVIDVVAVSAVRQLRMRAYRTGAPMNTCNYAAEFYISYLPAGSRLVLNTATRQSTVTLPNGAQTTGSHLLFGSDGNPYQWPDFLPKVSYTLVADLMPPFENTNSNVQILASGTIKD